MSRSRCGHSNCTIDCRTGVPAPAVVSPDDRLRAEVRRAYEMGAQSLRRSDLRKLSPAEIQYLLDRNVLTYEEARTLIEQQLVSRETARQPPPPDPYSTKIPIKNLKITLGGVELPVNNAYIVVGSDADEAAEAIAQAEAAFADESER